MNIKLRRRFAAVPGFASILAASAALGWATPESTAGLIIPDPIFSKTVSGHGDASHQTAPFAHVSADAFFDAARGDATGSQAVAFQEVFF